MLRLAMLGVLCVPAIAGAQVTGSFSLEKTTFAPGEPVVLRFTLHNAGKVTEEVAASDPYSFCSGYQLHTTRNGEAAPVCHRGGAGSCITGALSLAPGASHTERLLLNYRNTERFDMEEPVRRAGEYTVDVAQTIVYEPLGQGFNFFGAAAHDEARAFFHLRVDDALEVPPGVYAPYVAELSAEDGQTRREAVRTLATLAPPALEPLLLTFATAKDVDLKQFAPLALANLGTKASLAALAEMLVKNDPGTYEFIAAAEGLGKTHDPAWLPVLLAVADQHGSMYLSYAAESGGAAAVPGLLARLRSVGADDRGNVIRALGETGSRSAIPILIGLLGAPAVGERATSEVIFANGALAELTHVAADQGTDGTAIAGWQRRWQQWWQRAGGTAPLYRPEECGDTEALP